MKYVASKIVEPIAQTIPGILGVHELYRLKTVTMEQLKGQRVEMCLVPGSKLWDDGSLTPIMYKKLALVMRFSEEHPETTFIISGVDNSRAASDTDAMADYLIENGMEAGRIIRDYAGCNTLSAVRQMTNYARNCGSYLIIANDFHLARCLFAAKRIGHEAIGLPVPDSDNRFLAYYRMRESVACAKVFLTTKSKGRR